MKKFIYFLLIANIGFGSYFNLELEETGSSTLFIFGDSITTLDIGDEVGLYDQSGVTNASGDVGEVLVGHGIWSGSQLEVTSVNSIDLSDFGGPILPGAVNGNEMILKVWDASQSLELDGSYLVSNGTGTFNELFTAIQEVYAETDGANNDLITDGCDLPENYFYLNNGEVLYNSSQDIGGFQFSVNGATVNSASGGDAALAGFTVSNSSSTVLGFSFSGSVIESGCGVLTTLDLSGVPTELSNIIVSDSAGGSLSFNYYDDNSNGDGGCLDLDEDGVCDDVDDCVGFYDECGICNGDGSSCNDEAVLISFGDLGGQVLTILNVDYLSNQVCLDDVIVSGPSGESLSSAVGQCLEDPGFSGSNLPIYMNNNVEVAGFQFSVDGAQILSASGGSADANGFQVSSSSSIVLGFSLTGSTIPPYDSDCSNDVDEDGICDDIDDCIGFYDECGVCNGEGISDEYCDCDGNILDECGICNGGGIQDGDCDCNGNVEDCNGICGGDAVVDECGVCAGDGSSCNIPPEGFAFNSSIKQA
ncbi:MAG: hypothetical protein CMD06_00815, partial [Flavobacteriales bacterium]|nr:hypothetical protein [Flavobacteriales bacterium]